MAKRYPLLGRTKQALVSSLVQLRPEALRHDQAGAGGQARAVLDREAPEAASVVAAECIRVNL